MKNMSSKFYIKDALYDALFTSISFRVGCPLVANSSWKTDAPADTYIVGLKELPENDNSPLHHTHIFFAHCFKNQGGWKELLHRFDVGKGTILDLEFLNDASGKLLLCYSLFYMGGKLN